MKKRNGAKYNGIYFLGTVVFIYFLLFFRQPENIEKSLKVSADALIQIFPSLLLIILLMGIMNYFGTRFVIIFTCYIVVASIVQGWIIQIIEK